MASYDSAAAREIARTMQRADDILEKSVGEYRAVFLQTEELSGAAAEAMEEQLRRMIRTARSLEAEISDMGRAMHRYADTLEALDEQLAREI